MLRQIIISSVAIVLMIPTLAITADFDTRRALSHENFRSRFLNREQETQKITLPLPSWQARAIIEEYEAQGHAAENFPNFWAWKTFALANSPRYKTETRPRWEYWATDRETFPERIGSWAAQQ